MKNTFKQQQQKNPNSWVADKNPARNIYFTKWNQKLFSLRAAFIRMKIRWTLQISITYCRSSSTRADTLCPGKAIFSLVQVSIASLPHPEENKLNQKKRCIVCTPAQQLRLRQANQAVELVPCSPHSRTVQPRWQEPPAYKQPAHRWMTLLRLRALCGTELNQDGPFQTTSDKIFCLSVGTV